MNGWECLTFLWQILTYQRTSMYLMSFELQIKEVHRLILHFIDEEAETQKREMICSEKKKKKNRTEFQINNKF